jgi:hypothetical protein
MTTGPAGVVQLRRSVAETQSIAIPRFWLGTHQFPRRSILSAGRHFHESRPIEIHVSHVRARVQLRQE